MTFPGKKIVAGLLIGLILAPAALTPLPARALIGVPSITIADYDMIKPALNGLAWAAAKAVVQAMTQSIVQWINSGFNGSPAFATNLNRNLRQLADGAAAGLINELISNTEINSPWLQQIGGTVAAGYLLYTSRDRLGARLEYTLNQYLTDPRAWVRGDFRQGGFNAWMSATFRCGNDRYCSEFTAQEELINRLDSELETRLREVGYGRGFLSWRCGCGDSEEGGDTALSDADNSGGECNVCTPGSVIENQLAEHMGSGIRSLELADSINEIVGALAVQLVSQAISGSGLIGASEPGPGGGRSFLEQAGSELPIANTATLSTGFRESVEGDRQRVTTLDSAASAAVAACETGEFRDQTKLADARAISERLDGLAEQLDALLARIAPAEALTGAAQSSAILQITNDYTRLVAEGRIPSVSEVDPAGPEAISTLARMNAIVSSGCR